MDLRTDEPAVAHLRDLVSIVANVNTSAFKETIQRACETPEGRASLEAMLESHIRWEKALSAAQPVFREAIKNIRRGLRKQWGLLA